MLKNVVINGTQPWAFDGFNNTQTGINVYFVNGVTHNWVKTTAAAKESTLFRISDNTEWVCSVSPIAARTTRTHVISSTNNLNVTLLLSDIGTDYATFNALPIAEKNAVIVTFFTNNPMSLNYQLAEPVISDNVQVEYKLNGAPAESLTAFANGTLYVDIEEDSTYPTISGEINEIPMPSVPYVSQMEHPIKCL